MPVVYRCDGCGREAAAEELPHGAFTPRSWYERRDKDGGHYACSRECIDKVASATGKTGLVLPI